VGGGPSADKSRESGVIREIDAWGGARAASGKCVPDQTSDNYFDVCGNDDERLEESFIARCVIPPRGRDDYFAYRFIPPQHSAG
jgi:hypothetical protein